MKLSYPEHDKVARQKNLSIHSAPQSIEPAQHPEIIPNKDPVEDLDASPKHELVADIADTESQLPTPVPQTKIFPGDDDLLLDSIVEPWERDAQVCHEMNIPNNLYCLFATREEYNYSQCGIRKKNLKTYNDNMLKGENTPRRVPSFKNGDDLQKLVASIPDVQALEQWELHSLEDMRRNDCHQRPNEYWC